MYRFELQGANLTVQNFASGLDLTGKWVLINSQYNNISRYYTICHWLWSGIYDEYIKAMTSVVEGDKYNRKYDTIVDFQNQSSDSLELVMKVSLVKLNMLFNIPELIKKWYIF